MSCLPTHSFPTYQVHFRLTSNLLLHTRIIPENELSILPIDFNQSTACENFVHLSEISVFIVVIPPLLTTSQFITMNQSARSSFALLALLVVLTADVAFAAKSCEVCTKVLQKVVDQTKVSGKDFTPEVIEEQFIDYCKETEVSVENRFVSQIYCQSIDSPV